MWGPREEQKSHRGTQGRGQGSLSGKGLWVSTSPVGHSKGEERAQGTSTLLDGRTCEDEASPRTKSSSPSAR